MQRVGVGGALVMEVDYDTPKGPVPFASREWHNLFKHLCAESKRLGMQIRMNNDAGYCGSGGPWITPELSMQKIVWTGRVIKGPRNFDGPLKQPEAIEGFYRDIATLAFPTPESDQVRMADFSPRFSSSTDAPASVLQALVDGDTNTTVTLPQPEPNKASFIQVQFDRPFNARQLTLKMPVSGDQIVHGVLQWSEDGRVFRTVREFDVIPSTQLFNFTELSARYFRVLFPTKNADVEQFVISEFELSPRLRIEGIEAKGLFVRKLSYPGPSDFPGRASYPSLPPGLALRREQIVDLSSHLDKEGRLKWRIPPGSWTVLRLGHTSTGKKNHPAPEGGTGLECDKLSKTATEAMFNGLMAKLVAEVKPIAPGILVSTHIDSWEVGSQNWTPTFARDFRKLRGYDLVRFMPVLTGRVIDSFEISERFLWDFRQTVSDLLVVNYAGHMRELAHRHGLTLSIEAYDGPCDDLTYGGQADEPMAEFWSWPGFEMAYTCTEMSSVAHVYGKKIVGVEAFTAMDAEKWQGHPFAVKAFGDWAFCEGLNRFIIHRYALQPWTDPPPLPGMAFGPFGLHLERTETWWDFSKPWYEYLTRCQYLLQQGRFVADICRLAPEMTPRRWQNPDRSGSRGGYNFDACPTEVVLKRMSVKGGRFVLPDGTNYRVMALPDSETMTPELLARITDLVESGATVVGAPPAKSPSLSGYPGCDERLAHLVKALWGPCDGKTVLEHKFGRGKVFWGPSPEQVLAQSGMPQDFAAKTDSGASTLIYTHRTLPGAEVYFVANRALETTEAVCSFRVRNMRPEFWFPDTGKTQHPAVYEADDNTVRLPLRLGPAGSIFIIFRKNQSPELDRITSVSLNGESVTSTLLPGSPSTEELSDDATNTFTMAVWVRPEAGTTLPKEAVFGKGEYFNPRNDVLYPLLGHFRYRSPDHAGAGLSVGTNGVWVIECSADYWGSPLVWSAPLTNWTHLTVVYRHRRPSLFLNGKLVHEGLQSGFTVHCPVNVPQRRGSAPFIGQMGQFFHAHRALSHNEVAELARTMPVPRTVSASPEIEFTRSGDGSLNGLAYEPGHYVAQTASGKTWRFELPETIKPVELSGPWELSFPPNWGAPTRVQLAHLISWSVHPDPGVRYFSGTGTYRKTFSIPEHLLEKNTRLLLDLGKVAIIARVKLNGRDLGTLWKPPFRVDITHIVKAGENSLEVEVVNLWINRMIGDEQLPEDSDRNPNGSLKRWPEWLEQRKPSPTGRYTFTSYRLWKKDSPLQDSGLLGPVTIIPAKTISTKAGDAR